MAQELVLPDRIVGASPVDPTVGMLERQLRQNQQRYQELDAYYHGQHSHTFDSIRFQQAFGRQLATFADNWLKLTVQVTVDRLAIEGFRVEEEEDASDVDMLAWKIWKANHLRRGSRVAHRDAMKFGTSFLLVDPLSEQAEDNDNLPRVTVESPMQVVGQHAPDDRTRLVTAIKKWIGPDNYLYLTYFTPEAVLKYRSISRSPQAIPNDPMRFTQPGNWAQYAEVANPLGEVPIVPIENEPDAILGGISDLTDLIPLNDGLNKTLRDALVVSEYQGFRQRAVMGVDIPRGPDGKPLTEAMAQLTASEKRVWMFPNPETKMFEFQSIDLTPHMAMVDTFIHHISMVSRTPAYMLVGKMSNLSADALRAAELGFVGKLEGKQEDYDPAWERMMSLAFKCADKDFEDEDIQTVWKDAAANSGSVLSNELSQMVALGLPRKAALVKWGATPTEIARWEKNDELGPVEPKVAAPGFNGHPQVKIDAGKEAPDG